MEQRQNSTFSTRRMESHLADTFEGSCFYCYQSGPRETSAPEPAATRSHSPLLSFRAGSFAFFRFLGSVLLFPCYLSPFLPPCKLPALCAEGEGAARSLLAAALTQRKSKYLSGSLVCISLLCLQRGREALLQLELMPRNSVFQGWV